MNKRQIILILLFSTLAGLISCNRGPMKNVNLHAGDYKMYFIDISQHYRENKSCEFIERYKNFYIDDNYVLNVFKNELIKEKDHEFKLGKCFYVIQLHQNQEIKFGAFLSLENKKLKSSKIYNFNLEKLETYEKEFKKLEAFIINCYSIKNSKKLISDIEENGGYIHGISGVENQPFHNKSGRIKLMIDTSHLNQRDEYVKIEKQIKGDFSHIEEIYISHYHSNIIDTIEIDILCSSDISDIIPKGYKIIESFTDSIDAEMYVYDLQRKIIDSIILQNNINRVDIIDLNEKKLLVAIAKNNAG